ITAPGPGTDSGPRRPTVSQGRSGISRVAAGAVSDVNEAVVRRDLHGDLSRGEDPVVVVVDGVAGHLDGQRARVGQVDTSRLQVVSVRADVVAPDPVPGDDVAAEVEARGVGVDRDPAMAVAGERVPGHQV